MINKKHKKWGKILSKLCLWSFLMGENALHAHELTSIFPLHPVTITTEELIKKIESLGLAINLPEGLKGSQYITVQPVCAKPVKAVPVCATPVCAQPLKSKDPLIPSQISPPSDPIEPSLEENPIADPDPETPEPEEVIQEDPSPEIDPTPEQDPSPPELPSEETQAEEELSSEINPTPEEDTSPIDPSSEDDNTPTPPEEVPQPEQATPPFPETPQPGFNTVPTPLGPTPFNSNPYGPQTMGNRTPMQPGSPIIPQGMGTQSYNPQPQNPNFAPFPQPMRPSLGGAPQPFLPQQSFHPNFMSQPQSMLPSLPHISPQRFPQTYSQPLQQGYQPSPMATLPHNPVYGTPGYMPHPFMTQPQSPFQNFSGGHISVPPQSHSPSTGIIGGYGQAGSPQNHGQSLAGIVHQQSTHRVPNQSPITVPAAGSVMSIPKQNHPEKTPQNSSTSSIEHSTPTPAPSQTTPIIPRVIFPTKGVHSMNHPQSLPMVKKLSTTAQKPENIKKEKESTSPQTRRKNNLERKLLKIMAKPDVPLVIPPKPYGIVPASQRFYLPEKPPEGRAPSSKQIRDRLKKSPPIHDVEEIIPEDPTIKDPKE